MFSDAALGNVNEAGAAEDAPMRSQSCFAVLLGDSALVSGKKGGFNVLDFRSRRLQRVCRSSCSAETIGVEEDFDAAQLGRDLLKGTAADYVWSCHVPLVGVTDAKDSCNRLSTDTGFGSQKSLCFTIAASRRLLRRRWQRPTCGWTRGPRP